MKLASEMEVPHLVVPNNLTMWPEPGQEDPLKNSSLEGVEMEEFLSVIFLTTLITVSVNFLNLNFHV